MSQQFIRIRSTPPTIGGARSAKPLLLTVEEAADLLRIGRTKLYELVQEGGLRPVHLGRTTRFTMHELERFVSQLDGGTPAA